MKKNKKLCAIIICMILVMGVTSIANAAWYSFNVKLPVNQGDVELPYIARASTSVNYFTIKVDSISDGLTDVRAWVESKVGANLSSNTKQVSVGTTNVRYTYVPTAGQNVKLNLDNPVKLTITPTVKGSWTPN